MRKNQTARIHELCPVITCAEYGKTIIPFAKHFFRMAPRAIAATSLHCFSPCRSTGRSSSFPPMPERIISDVLTKPDVALEMTLRPSLFSEFTGQAKVKERLEITVTAAQQRNE